MLYCPFCGAPVSYGIAACGNCKNALGWIALTRWIDPLINFNWGNLYQEYDKACRGFNPGSGYLNIFKSNRPAIDRDCYNELITLVSSEIAAATGISLPTYLAITYWKLYSQPAAVKNVCHEINAKLNDNSLQSSLAQLTSPYNIPLSKSPNLIVLQLKGMDKHAIRGIKSHNAIPVRATLLHMVYPNVVPLFDQHVLAAVGLSNKAPQYAGAQYNYGYYQIYTDHIWELAQKYSPAFHGHFIETPLRIVDMALWVIRYTNKTKTRRGPLPPNQ